MRSGVAPLLLVVSVGLSDAPVSSSASRGGRAEVEPVRACEGLRPPLPRALYLTLRSAAFPGSKGPDAAVHVPPGFDATRSPAVVLYFHGWRGCVAAALAGDDVPCEEGGEPRHAAGLAQQLDDARVNALLVAIELRADETTGEPGELESPGRARAILGEVLRDLEEPLGCALVVDTIERIVVLAHSGGYQAAASVLEFGDLPQVSEIALLDALYGADDVFRSFLSDVAAPGERGLRFVDLYTCCGGTFDRSRAFARLAHDRSAPWAVFDDDGATELDPAALARPIVFKRVPEAHGALPRAYVRALLENAGLPRIEPAAAAQASR